MGYFGSKLIDKLEFVIHTKAPFVFLDTFTVHRVHQVMQYKNALNFNIIFYFQRKKHANWLFF